MVKNARAAATSPGAPCCPTTTPTTPALCGSPSSGTWSGQRGAKWINGHYGDTLYNHYDPPNAAAYDCDNTHHSHALTAARSLHEGGVHITLCDGSARFVNENVDLTLWRSLATRNGGETTPDY